ncbi:MAG: histidine phosphatase family protein [Acidimicrobiia bacterium]|nr:histidine phosphatase family protein [Acidimicrobiia bacterium]
MQKTASFVASPFASAMLTGQFDLELVLVRHGQQIPWDERTEPNHRTDPPLTELGSRQIDAVAAYMADESVTTVYSSHLDRARRTGEAIAARHDLAPTVMSELREVELMRDVPDDADLGDAFDKDAMDRAGAEFVRTRRWDAFPMAETGAELRERVTAAIEGIIAENAHNPGGRVVIACHGGVINAYLVDLLGIEVDMFFRPPHCSVHRVHVGDGRRIIGTLNETHHLVGDLLTH